MASGIGGGKPHRHIINHNPPKVPASITHQPTLLEWFAVTQSKIQQDGEAREGSSKRHLASHWGVFFGSRPVHLSWLWKCGRGRNWGAFF